MRLYQLRMKMAINNFLRHLLSELKKYQAPGTTAAIFLLKNMEPLNWRDKQEINHSGEINNPFEYLTTEELRKLAKDN